MEKTCGKVQRSLFPLPVDIPQLHKFCHMCAKCKKFHFKIQSLGFSVTFEFRAGFTDTLYLPNNQLRESRSSLDVVSLSKQADSAVTVLSRKNVLKVSFPNMKGPILQVGLYERNSQKIYQEECQLIPPQAVGGRGTYPWLKKSLRRQWFKVVAMKA